MTVHFSELDAIAMRNNLSIFDTEYLAEIEKALEFYADPQNWEIHFTPGNAIVPVKVDRGKIARQALGYKT